MKTAIKYTFIVSLLGISLTGCQDDWDAHYDQTASGAHGNQSLYEILEADPSLSDFCKVLNATKVFANSKQTTTTYRQMLDNDQFLTVWAPVNGSFNADSLVQLCATSEGDSLVEKTFVRNHLARYGQSLNGLSRTIKLLNGKRVVMDEATIGQSTYKESNIAARNGIVHIMNKPLHYYYNVYEAMVTKADYWHIGQFFKSYQTNILDEKNSLSMGLVDGKTVYIDSVYEAKNELLEETYDGDANIGRFRLGYSHLDREDSLYWMIMPTKEVWEPLYAEAKQYFNYGSLDNEKDSISERWTHYALLQDCFFNPNIQKSINDSIVSTTYINSTQKRSHTYWYPFDASKQGKYKSGLFTTNWAKEEDCCNGKIYEVNEWPFSKYNYFDTITVEAETTPTKYEANNSDGGKLEFSYYYIPCDSISADEFICVTPVAQRDNFYIEYQLPNVLSGTYDIYVVFLPKSVNSAIKFEDEMTLPCKFNAEIFYVDTLNAQLSVASNKMYKYDEENFNGYTESEDGEFLFDCNFSPESAKNRAFETDPYRVDAVKLCTMRFPTCNFAQKNITNRLRLTNNIGKKEVSTHYSIWYIDKILLVPNRGNEEK